MAKSVDVPCNGCTACCRNQLIVLHPEDQGYDDIHTKHPTTGKPVRALRQRENGDCIYLKRTGCGIHGRAPLTCRKFDCRALLREMLDVGSWEDIERGIEAGVTEGAIMYAAKERLDHCA